MTQEIKGLKCKKNKLETILIRNSNSEVSQEHSDIFLNEASEKARILRELNECTSKKEELERLTEESKANV